MNRSPQARGSTDSRLRQNSSWPPVPAGAGLNRSVGGFACSRASGPRRRGAQPYPQEMREYVQHRSPQARGSTGHAEALGVQARPVPAGAGLNRHRPAYRRHPATGPRRRGAQPAEQAATEAYCHRSPQARGSTGARRHVEGDGGPVPAGAGLNRTLAHRGDRKPPGPRRRGAQPHRCCLRPRRRHRSPQARGSTAHHPRALPGERPVPAGAGLNRRTG